MLLSFLNCLPLLTVPSSFVESHKGKYKMAALVFSAIRCREKKCQLRRETVTERMNDSIDCIKSVSVPCDVEEAPTSISRDRAKRCKEAALGITHQVRL